MRYHATSYISNTSNTPSSCTDYPVGARLVLVRSKQRRVRILCVRVCGWKACLPGGQGPGTHRRYNYNDSTYSNNNCCYYYHKIIMYL